MLSFILPYYFFLATSLAPKIHTQVLILTPKICGIGVIVANLNESVSAESIALSVDLDFIGCSKDKFTLAFHILKKKAIF